MAFVRTTDATSEPVSLEDARLHLRVDIGDDDTEIDGMITAARRACENLTGRAFINQTWKLTMDQWYDHRYTHEDIHGYYISPPIAPLSSVTSITYTDSDGVSQTLSSSIYTVDTSNEPGRIYIAYNQTLPTIRSIRNSVIVTLVAGYGASASSVPDPIKHAIKLLLGHWYRNRESVTPNAMTVLPQAVEYLLQEFIVPEFR